MPETKGRWTSASQHEPRMLEPVVITSQGGSLATWTVLTSMSDALVLLSNPRPGVHSPELSLREAGRVLAMLEG